MLAALSKVVWLSGVLCTPRKPFDLPAWPHPKLTLSLGVTACVSASHVALGRERSFWKSRSEGRSRCVLSQSALTVVLVANVYWPPILNAVSSPTSRGSRLARSL